MRNVVDRLQTWYRTQCDDEWEHSFGIAIDTLDNPGWSVRIDLVGTALADRPFIEIERTVDDETWLRCSVATNQFRGYGGALMLDEILRVFLDWAEAESGDRPTALPPSSA